jgi:hypothetical protein
MSEKFTVIDTIKDGIAIGSKNIGPILVNVLLWVITIWIPYLNVGTTIGLMAGIVTKASRGEVIPVTEIFDPKYRRYMGEFFLTSGLIGLGVGAGLFFFFIPGIVIAIAWSLAILLVVDKGKNPTEAITMSNNCTYGYKKKIFGINFLLSLIVSIIVLILSGIAYAVNDTGLSFMISLFIMLIGIFTIFVSIGIQASIYKKLTEGV